MTENKTTRPCGILLPAAFDETIEASAENAVRAGLDTCMLTWNGEDRSALAKDAAAVRMAGLDIASVHGPFEPIPGIKDGVNCIWAAGEAGEIYADRIMDCIEDAAAARIPVVVLHVTYFYGAADPGPIGLERFRRIGAHAEALGVRLAVEPVELIPHVEAVLDTLSPAVYGLCFDSGHSFAYTPEYDPLARYKGRVLTVHLHDNDGKKTDGPADTRDDEHFLPFDGKIDWADTMSRLREAGYDGPIVLESKRGRACCRNIPAYREMGQAKFFEEACRRAKRLAEL